MNDAKMRAKIPKVTASRSCYLSRLSDVHIASGLRSKSLAQTKTSEYIRILGRSSQYG